MSKENSSEFIKNVREFSDAMTERYTDPNTKDGDDIEGKELTLLIIAADPKIKDGEMIEGSHTIFGDNQTLFEAMLQAFIDDEDFFNVANAAVHAYMINKH